MSEVFACRDIYVRYTQGGKSHVTCHRVWDAERFMRARESDVEKVNADIREKAAAETVRGASLTLELHSVQQITEEQYRRERGNWNRT